MKQEKRISYRAGITRRPSDFLCQDGELAECINLATDNEELKPMVQPEVYMTEAPKVIYVHKFNDEERFVTIDGYENIGWGIRSDEGVYVAKAEGQPTPDPDPFNPDPFDPGDGNLIDPDVQNEPSGSRSQGDTVAEALMTAVGEPKVTSVGKTLIIADDNGLHYFLWKDSEYKALGDIPDPQFEFYLKDEDENTVQNSGDTHDIVETENSEKKIKDNQQEKFNDLIIGLYAKNKRQIAQKKAFCLPFFVRTAIKMYDETYTHISQPILLFPCVTENTYGYEGDWGYNMFTRYRKLYFKQLRNYEDWSDIVKEVTIFVSDGIEVHDLIVDQEIVQPARKMDGIYRYGTETFSLYHTEQIDSATYSVDRHLPLGDYSAQVQTDTLSSLIQKNAKEIDEAIKGKSIFYRLADIGRKPINSETCLSDYFETHTLENLVNQEQLVVDDFYSRNKLFPEYMYAYNSRLNVAAVKRGFFDGFDSFLVWDNYINEYQSRSRASGGDEPGGGHDRYQIDIGYDIPAGTEGGGSTPSGTPTQKPAIALYDFYVTIQTDAETVTVKHRAESKQKQGVWFFYPDPRAKHVLIVKAPTLQEGQTWDGTGGTVVCNQDLTEHPGLNGAYFYRGLPGVEVHGEATEEDGSRTYDNDAKEILPNYIITSLVDNPFVMKVYNKVGTGKILGMSTTTMALSQDNFGRTDLIVFSESGLWGMQVDKTGLFNSVHPVTRDVCINPKCITQTDGAVFFVSKKGLMVASQDGVRCVSEAMNGEAFNTAVLPVLNNQLYPIELAIPFMPIITACQDDTTFLDFIRDGHCMMAYDYIDSRLLIINSRTSNNLHDFPYCWAFSLADGSFSKTVLPEDVGSVVNSYPDYLMQSGENVYSLYGKKREEEVTQRQAAFLLTRPMKLEGPDAVTSLRELVNVGMWRKKDSQGNELSCVKTQVWISDDLYNWYAMSSRFGAAAKYFRIGLFISMLPTERLSGTIIMQQPRRTNNERV